MAAAEAALRKDGTSSAVPQPARGYSRPPFEPGNAAAVKHGAFSEKVISRAAARIRELLLDRYAYLGDEAFSEALERYTRAEARSQVLHDYVMAVAEEEGVLAVKPYLWTEASRAEANAAKLGQDCGLDATGHARIARDLGFAQNVRQQANARATAKLATTGRELRTARQKGQP